MDTVFVVRVVARMFAGTCAGSNVSQTLMLRVLPLDSGSHFFVRRSRTCQLAVAINYRNCYNLTHRSGSAPVFTSFPIPRSFCVMARPFHLMKKAQTKVLSSLPVNPFDVATVGCKARCSESDDMKRFGRSYPTDSSTPDIALY